MNAGGHITRELLTAFERGELSDRQLVEILRDHLETVCPECRDASDAARAHETPRSAYRNALQQVQARLRRGAEIETMQREAERVPGLLKSLETLSPEQRLLRIRNTPERYANRMLCEELLARARACLPFDPAGSRGWAETAREVAALYPEPYPAHEIRALGFLGNAERAVGHFDPALALLRRAQVMMARNPVTDLEVGAELHSFFGSLFTDLRRFDEAGDHLDAALGVYDLIEDDEASARVVMKMANLHRYLGRLDEALEADRTAIALLPPGKSPALHLAARINQALDLHWTGRHDQARRIVHENRELVRRHADSHTRLRVHWLEGCIAAATGEVRLAERILTEVRDRFVYQEHGFNCALVCLDLAALHHRQGHHRDALEDATRAVRLFDAYEVHRDALAALLVVRDAAAAERLTAGAIRRAATVLQQAAHAPSARSEG
ncbi:MAG: hypothetical protein PVG07_06280 [Acidobacteriota bacterium]|jgi:tetratricopeptide (TPR) repeat protein